MAHIWLSGGRRADRMAAAGPGLAVDADRRHRGPYTAAGSVLRALAPGWPADLLAPHATEVLAAAPELTTATFAPPHTLTSTASPDERTRWYSQARTRRLAHGLVDLLRAAPDVPTLVLDPVDRADRTDQELVAVALRRLDPGRARLVVGTAGRPEGELAEALARYAERRDVPATPAPPGSGADHVESDGTDEDHRDAYEAADPAVRAGWHDRRAAALAEADVTWRRAALPWHLMHGTDPLAGFEAGWQAVGELHGLGFYDAVADLTETLSELVERFPDQLGDRRFALLMWHVQALTMGGRAEQAELELRELLTRTDDARAQKAVLYQLGMLLTRHLAEDRKDHPVDAGLAAHPDEPRLHCLAGQLAQEDDDLERARTGYDRALAVDPDLHEALAGRAAVAFAQERWDDATADLDRAVALAGDDPDVLFIRGFLHQSAGRWGLALADYDRAAVLAGADRAELDRRRAECRAELAGALR